ncbi:MAG: NUDIX domain-containing protein [Ignavibacteria bacterium]
MSRVQPYSTITQELLHDNGYWRYKHDRYTLPDGKKESDYFYADSHGSTIIIPILDDNRLIMVKQFRYLNQKTSMEFPGGGLPAGLNPDENAHKELLEETGMKAAQLINIGSFNPCNGITNELCSVYIAKQLTFIGHNADETEDIEIVNVSMDECNSLIQTGEIWDGMTLASWTLFQTVQSKDFSP